MLKFKLLLVLLAVLLAPLGRAAVLYTVTALPAGFNPADLNNAGQMAGALYTGTGGVHAAVYNDGVVTDLGAPGATYSFANAINEAGTVTGNFDTGAGAGHAFIYQYGNLRDIGAAYALALNASGDVVGQRYLDGGATGFLYSGGTMRDIGHLGTGNVSLAAAINDSGQVVGESNLAIDGQEPTHPYLYEDGTLQDLGTLANRGVNSAVAINNAGQVAGYSAAPDGRMHAFLYDHGALTDLGSFGGLDVTIGGINQRGEVVGTGNTPDGPDVAFISSNGGLVDLDTLIDATTGWHITSALDINDHGQIIGYGCRDTTCTAVRLDLAGAVPEPAAVWLLLPGVLLLTATHKRACRRCFYPLAAI